MLPLSKSASGGGSGGGNGGGEAGGGSMECASSSSYDSDVGNSRSAYLQIAN